MITLITGENEFAIKAYADEVTEKFATKHGEDSVIKRRGEDLKVNDFPDLFTGNSLFSTNQIVVIDQPQQNRELCEYLIQNIGDLPAETELVLVEPKPDKRLKWFGQVKKHGQIIDKANLSPPELSRWIQTEVKARGGQIDSAGARYLVERAGNNQWQLHNEIDKLINFKPEITKKQIDELVEPSLDETIFQLLDLALQGKASKALAIYDELIKRDLDAFQTVTMMGWQVHNMVIVKTNINSSLSQLAGRAGLAPFVVSKTQRLVRNITLGQIKKLIELVLDAERDLKTTGIDAHQRTRHLVIQAAEITK